MENIKLKRKEFLKKALLAGGGVVFGKEIARALFQKEVEAEEEPYPVPDVVDRGTEDALQRMEEDLRRALMKPMRKRKWCMVIDIRKCVGCDACTISCKAENRLPPGVVYRPVIKEEIGEYPNVRLRFIPRPCMQCENPPCTPVCPVDATYKREDGIVVVDYNRCIGCRYCLTACPYNARSSDFGEFYSKGVGFFEELSAYENVPTHEYKEDWERNKGRSPRGNARKCHFCLHRIEKGLLPECVVTCLGRATYFGDKSDPDSLVSELISQPNVMRLKEELGTDPKVYYLL